MRPLNINFASALTLRNRARLSPPVAILGALVLVLIGIFLWQIALLESSRYLLNQESELLKESAVAARSKVSLSKAPMGHEEIVAINQAIRQLNLPWPDIFSGLEEATPDAIAVLALTPDSYSEVLTISAEAQTMETMIDYVRKLKGQKLFDVVTITKHEVNDKDPYKPIRFEVGAHWKVHK